MKEERHLRTMLIAFVVVLIGILAVGILYSWFFRDGLGPDSVQSMGLGAIKNTLCQAWPVFAILLLLISGCLIGIRRLK